MDWRQPWLLPRRYQGASFVLAMAVGVLLLGPWWLQSWQAWEDVNEAQAKLRMQQQTTQTLNEQTAKWLQAPSQLAMVFADTTVLTQQAQQQGLRLLGLKLDKPQQSPALSALDLQQLPVHLDVQGSWQAWLEWLVQWPSVTPGVTITSLELKANSQGGISAQVLALALASVSDETSFELAGVNPDAASHADPFSASGWAHAQRAHAAQHPSYVRLVAPELLRPREPLENFANERLQYVGHIASVGETEALVKVMPSAASKKEVAMMDVYRVRVGHHLGQNFGKVLAVEPDQLVVQELAVTPMGEWQPRELRLPLNVEAR